MKLEKGKQYVINFLINNKLLTYTCIIEEIENNFITFTDKYGKTFTYNITTIASYEEVEQ